MGRHLGLMALMACLVAAPTAAAPVAALANPEDIAPIDDRWAIVSSMAGGASAQGALFAVARGQVEARQLYPGPTKAASAAANGCGEPSARDFAPHGVALAKVGGALKLYVVNHGGREAIEIFEVATGQAPTLAWAGCVLLPPGANANAVAALADGTLFVSNMGKSMDGSPPLSMLGGDVLTWTPGRGWGGVPGSAVIAPNGLLASEDGRTLYVASWMGGEIVALARDGDHSTRRVLRLPFLPDNLRWSRRGAILAAGHRASVEAVVACFTGKGPCDVASSIAQIEPASLTLTCTRPVARGMATVAAEVGDELWVGGARGEGLMRTRAAACEGQP